MKVKILNKNEPIELKDIKKIEKKYKVKFPEDYIKFLLKYNGGDTNDYIYFVNNRTYSCFEIEKFFSLREIDINLSDNLEECEEDEDKINLVFNKMIPIAETRIDLYIQILICLSKEDYGKIYITHLLEDDEFVCVADNFKKFISGFSKPSKSEFEIACEEKDSEKALKLIHDGFDLNKKNDDNMNAFKLAMFYGLSDVIYEIIKIQNIPNPVHLATVNHQNELLLKLLEDGYNVNERDSTDKTPIFNAFYLDTLEILLKYGADVNAKMCFGYKASKFFSKDSDVYKKLKELEEDDD